RPGDHAPTLSREALRELSPDVVLIKPCGFALARSLDELSLLRTALPWESWPAVRAGRVYVADGNAYFNRPGPRIVESLEILAACLHPSAFGDLRARHRESVIRLDEDLGPHIFSAGGPGRRPRAPRSAGLGPGLLDPVHGGGGIVVPLPGLRPRGRRRHRGHRHRDDALGVPDRERIVGKVLAEADLDVLEGA